MSKSHWRPIDGVNLKTLSAARAPAHYAAQWLARAGYAYVPPKPDSSHTNVGWDDALDGFTTHPLKGELRLGLKIPQLALVLIEGKATSSFAMDGRTDADVRAWLGKEMTARGLDAKALDKPFPYELPAHPIAKGGAYGASGNAKGLVTLAAWFGNANASLGRIREAHNKGKLQASPVRCWPHHFDLATLILLDGDPEKGRSVNVGLSPGDGTYDEPYFYITPWPYPEQAKLPPLPPIGHWHTEGFTAAVALASSILESTDPQNETEAFLDAAVEGSIKALG
jgi:hypothetical protein